MNRFFRLGSISIFFIGVLFTVVPTTVNAQRALTPEEATVLRSDVESYLNDLPTDLLLCSNPERGTNGNIRSCGGRELAAGQLEETSLVSWGADDTVRCSFYSRFGNETIIPACRIDRSNGITTYFYDYVAATGGGYQIANFRGDQFIDGTSASGAQEIVDQGRSGILGGVESLARDALSGVAYLIFKFSTMLLGWAGTLLNWVMLRGVFQFSLLIGNSPGLLFAWSIIRDLGNILLLFGFIFIGVSTILGTSKFGDKKSLPKLLIFAILMNFSLFAAEAVIDTANVLASTIYNQASIDSCSALSGSEPVRVDSDSGNDLDKCALEYGIAGHMIQSTGLASLYAAESPAVETEVMIGLAAFATIGAVVIFAASFMLITRAVILTFLMVTSPIGFAGMALPPMQKFARDWWSRLLHQAFYAPILLLLILISLKITDSFTSNLLAGRNLGAAIQVSTASSMGVLFVFALVIGFLVASIVAAKKFGITGADFAMNMVNKTARLPIGAARGLGGIAGRNIVGRSAANLQKRHASAMANSPKWQQKTMMAIGLDRGINSALEKGQSAKFGSSSSFKSKKAENDARLKELGEVARKDKKKSEVGEADALSKKAAQELSDANKSGDKSRIKEAEERSVEANDKLANVLENLSAKEIEELGVLKKSGADLQRIAESLSAEKFGSLLKEGSGVSESKKEELRKARFQKINEVVGSMSDTIRTQQEVISSGTASDADKDKARAKLVDSTNAIRAVTKDYSARDLQNMSSEDLNSDALLLSLTNSQRDELLKSNNVSPATARKIKRYDPVEQVKTIHKNSPSEAAVRMREMKLNTAQVARLGIEVLQSPEVARALKVSEIKAIEKREDFGTDERNRLKRAIEDAGNIAVNQYMKNTERGVENWS